MALNKQSFSELTGIAPKDKPVIAGGDSAPPVPIVVGIGASAGGHEALEYLFTTMPSDCGLSFVVVMHLSADKPSTLSNLLRHYTSMDVVLIEDSMPPRPNTVFVLPPGKELTVHSGRLQLHDPERGERLHHPIDRFFSSLAADLEKCAIGVILSGFGADGSEGVKRIKEKGGMVLVQDPETAINPFMPQNAIATGATDLVLSPKEIADRLVRIAREKINLSPQDCLPASMDEELHSLFTILQARTGHDFSSYKKNTVLRRIRRRLDVNQTEGFSNYLDILRDTPEEAHALCKELLIGVTSFFRDPEAFDSLRSKIIPPLFANRKTGEPVRIWHACCATGEEAYSVAILILEYLEQEKLQAKVQIFATDLDEVAVAQARAGLYSDDIFLQVGEERLKRFFTRCQGRWKVTKPLREMIVFAHHNIIKDPPFSRIDLLVCRNFLIYLNPNIQKLLFPLFHQVLNPGGYLFLGSSETVGLHNDLFTPIDSKWKIFMRQPGKHRKDMVLPFSGSVRKLAEIERSVRSSNAQETESVAYADKLLMERYIPAHIIINEKIEAVHFSNRADAYLLIPEGKPTRDLLKIVKEELRPPLRAAIYKAFSGQKEVVYRGIKVGIDGGEDLINIIVTPLKEPPPAGRLALVIIEPASSAELRPAPSEESANGDYPSRNSLICHLEEQLRVTGEQLQSTCEQLETSNERFMLANEELMTVNEELQSANEELQSTNEELVTVNSELQKKMEELNQSNSDLENLLISSELASFFLNRELCIKHFSPAMGAIFNLIPADIGRPIHHLSGTIDWLDFLGDAQLVLGKLIPIEREVHSLKDDRCFIMRILPYKTTEGVIDGIVVTLVDISERKRSEEALRESQTKLEAALASMTDAVFISDTTGQFIEFNDAFASFHRFENKAACFKKLADYPDILEVLSPDGDPVPLEMWAVPRALRGETAVNAEYTLRRKDTGETWVGSYSFSPIRDEKNMIVGAVVVGRDITSLKQKEEALRLSEELYRSLFDNMLNGFAHCKMLFEDGVPKDFLYLKVNRAFETLTKLSDVVGKKVSEVIPGIRQSDPKLFEIYGRVALTGIPEQFETYVEALEMWFSISVYSPQKEYFVAVFDVITERKRAEEALLLSEQRRSLALGVARVGTWEWDLETNENIWSDELWSLYGLEPHSCKPSYDEWRKIVHPDDRFKIEQIQQDAIIHGIAYNTEWRVNLDDGTERWLMSRGRPIKDSQDRVVRYLGVVIDITERKRAEEEKKILQAQLIQAQKMEAIGTLAGGIAHDFNNILGALLGYAEMARDLSPTGSVIARDLDRVLEAGERATNLVKQILAFSRQASTERVPVEPARIVKEAVKLLRPALPSTITIEQHLDTATRPILADPTQIHQVVMNLCTNSFHAMELTGGILAITLREQELAPHDLPPQSEVQAGRFVVLSIADTGSGIVPAIRDKIFEPYFTTKEVGKGTGMGLSIVHGIVTTMGGFITCESELGRGTVFRVFFPALELEVAVGMPPVETALPGKEHVLFIDDEEILAEMGKIMLERLGYEVTVRTSSIEALATFQNQPDQFDAVITDQTMPGITGIDLARRMLQIRPDIPIILCTGYSNLVSDEQAKLLGIKGYLMKPMSKKAMAQLLRKVLDDHPSV